MQLTGTLEHVDLEGGTWFLETREERWVLLGPIPHHLNRRVVVVEGEVVESMGFHMAGPQLHVGTIKAAGTAAV